MQSPESSFSPAQYALLAPESSSSDKSQGADGSETELELFEFTGVTGEPCNCMESKQQQNTRLEDLVGY